MKNIKKLFTIITLFLALFILAGCSNVSEKNYEQIQNNMSKSKVISILGEANETTKVENYVVYYWFDGAESIVEANELVSSGKTVKAIVITMDEDVVVNKSYSDWKVQK